VYDGRRLASGVSTGIKLLLLLVDDHGYPAQEPGHAGGRQGRDAVARRWSSLMPVPSSSCLYVNGAQDEALSHSSVPCSLRYADDDEEQGRPGCRSDSSATLRGFGGCRDEVTAGLLCALLGSWAGWLSTRELRHLLELVA
jgi:hypothetical protein